MSKLEVVHARTAKGRQSTRHTAVFREVGAIEARGTTGWTIQVEVDADSYEFQSWVRVSCLKVGEWADPIVTLLGSEMHSAGEGLHAEEADLLDDRDRALRLACQVLGIRQ